MQISHQGRGAQGDPIELHRNLIGKMLYIKVLKTGVRSGKVSLTGSGFKFARRLSDTPLAPVEDRSRWDETNGPE